MRSIAVVLSLLVASHALMATGIGNGPTTQLSPSGWNVPAMDMVPDGDGGAYVAWLQSPSSLPGFEGWVSQINADGSVNWTEPVCDNCDQIEIAHDRLTNELTIMTRDRDPERWHYYLTRLDANGASIWGSSPVRVTLDWREQENGQLAVDHNNRAYVTWPRIDEVFVDDAFKPVRSTVLVQRIDPDGSRVWGNGIPIRLTVAKFDTPLAAVAHPFGGVVVAFRHAISDAPNATGGIALGWVDPSGSPVQNPTSGWLTENFLDSQQPSYFDMARMDNGSVACVWNRGTNDNEVRFMGISTYGEKLFAAPQFVTGLGGSTPALRPSLATNGDRAFVAYGERLFGSFGAVRVSSYDIPASGDGSTIFSALVVAQELDAYPRVVPRAHAGAHVTYRVADTTNLFSQEVIWSGQLDGSPHLLSTGTPNYLAVPDAVSGAHVAHYGTNHLLATSFVGAAHITSSETAPHESIRVCPAGDEGEVRIHSNLGFFSDRNIPPTEYVVNSIGSDATAFEIGPLPTIEPLEQTWIPARHIGGSGTLILELSYRTVPVATLEKLVRSPDFDNSGAVAVGDVGILANANGSCVGDPEFDPRVDIDAATGESSGCIGLDDIGVFVAHNGHSYTSGGSSSKTLPLDDDWLSSSRLSFEPSRNPFATNVAFAYEVPHNAHVRVRLFDARGRTIRSLVDGTREAGHYVAHWDGRDEQGASVARGVYYGTLEVGAESVTRKLVRTD